MRARRVWGVCLALTFALSACGSRGAVTFDIEVPIDARMRPNTDQVSEYRITAADGTVVGIASANPQSPSLLGLGPLMANMMPTDVVVEALSGSELLGMARIRGVSIQPGVQSSYEADVRKPLVFVGFTAPIEPDGHAQTKATKILDSTTSSDLAHPTVGQPVSIADITSGAATSDGRFFLGGHTSALDVFDTGGAVSVGDVPLDFTPVGVAVAADDTAMAVIDNSGSDGNVWIFGDVAGLTTSPSGATPSAKSIVRSAKPRAVAFSPDGQRIYVLTGGTDVLDPCDGAAPAANGIDIIGVDGQQETAWSLPAFAAGLAVDQATGAVLVTLPSMNEVASIDPNTPGGPATLTKLFSAACPSALNITSGTAIAISGGASGTLQLASGSSSTPGNPQLLAMPVPNFSQDEPPPTGSGPNFNQKIIVTPQSLAGYTLAVTPDGSRGVFGTHVHYVVADGDLGFNLCKINYDVVEYDLYQVDLRSGAASYSVRAIVPSVGAGCAISGCVDEFGLEQPPIPCDNLKNGDRTAGIAAVFGGP